MSKQDFLTNMRLARSLFENERVMATVPAENTADSSKQFLGMAIWLTPKSVEHFNPADFPELGEKQARLQQEVLAFRSIARETPSNVLEMDEHLSNARAVFERILEILEPYLPVPEEWQRVEDAVRKLQLPEWIVTWDFQIGNDHDDMPAVWLNVYADEEAMPRKLQLARSSLQLTQDLRKELNEAKINRWPYVRMRSAQWQKAK